MISRTLNAASVVALTFSLAACGNVIDVEVDGFVGISHDGFGGLIVHVAVCGNMTSVITFSEIGTNQLIGRYVTEVPMEGYFAVPLGGRSAWVGDPPFQLPEGSIDSFRVDAEPIDNGGSSPFAATKVITPVSSNYAAVVSRDTSDILVDVRFEESNFGAVTLDQFKSRLDCTSST